MILGGLGVQECLWLITRSIRRPEWQTSVDISKTKKKEVECLFHFIFIKCAFQITLLEKHKRKFAERKRNDKNTSMVKISIEGARMQLGQ